MDNCTFDADNIVPLVINSGSLLMSLVAMVAVVTHGKIEQSLRGILISFLTANIVAACIFFYDIIAYACEYHSRGLSFIFKVSMVLTLAHLLLLIVHYHIAIADGRKITKAKDFVGLILTAWISSATLGCVNAALKKSVSKILIIVLFLLIVLIIIRAFIFIAKEQKHQKVNARVYQQRFLHLQQEELEKLKEMEEDDFASPPIKQWNLKILGIISLSSVLCSIPWMILNIVGLSEERRHLEHALPLSIYAIGFYVLAGVCMYIRYRNWKTECAPVTYKSPPAPETKRPSFAVERKTSKEDLVSNMEGEESYGTFGL